MGPTTKTKLHDKEKCMQPMVFTSQINLHIFVCTAVITAVKYFHLGFMNVSEQAAVVSRRIANDGRKGWELKMRRPI